MRMTAPKLTATVLLFLALNSQAQLRFSASTNDLKNNLSIILSEYAVGFSTLKGDTISVNPQSIEFATKLDFPGCEKNSITQYNSKDLIYSWQALLLRTEDFKEASKKYRWLFDQLKAIIVTMQDYSFTLSGDYVAPDETKNFCSTIFKLTSDATNTTKLRIEASMQFEFPEWKISLLVYEREREDNERGEIKQ